MKTIANSKKQKAKIQSKERGVSGSRLMADSSRPQYQIVNSKSKTANGSALILTVTISVLLAIIAVLFILRTSVDSIGTLSVSDNKELSYAVETVVAQLSRELVQDTPSVGGPEKYHTYPGPENIWLANLEPYSVEDPPGSGTLRYYWGQVSDLYGGLGAARNDVVLNPAAAVVRDDGKAIAAGDLADADGDGIADSIWVQARSGSGTVLRTSAGRPLYLALRVVDLGGMLNANTAYKFNPADPNLASDVGYDGSSVTQINLFGLAARGSGNSITQLEQARQGGEPAYSNSSYTPGVVRRLDQPDPGLKYAPFDIGDELKLRYRYILNLNDGGGAFSLTSRIELLWNSVWDIGAEIPRPSLSDWVPRVILTLDPNDPKKYDYRHITTTYNCDRLIDPNGKPMMNPNKEADPAAIYEKLREALPAVDPNVLAQFAVNIKDYRDPDHQVSWLPRPDDPNYTFYGHSSPFMWISELAYSQYTTTDDPPVTQKAWAIELYVPQTIPPTDPNWRLVVGGVDYSLPSSGSWGTPPGTSRFLVLTNDSAGLFGFADPNTRRGSAIEFADGSLIELQRIASDGNWVTVDHVTVPVGLVLSTDTLPASVRRDISMNRAIRKVWDSVIAAPTLGVDNAYDGGGAEIQYFTKDADFTTIGELGNVLIRSTNEIGPLHTEPDVRFNWLYSDPNTSLSDLARYFTVMEAHPDVIDRIYGRININTAPYFVLAQLPWMQYDFPMTSPDPAPDPARFARARDVVAYRDDPAVRGFRSVAEVLRAPRMQDLAVPPDGDLIGPPDLSPDDVLDDFEERDILFHRISDLATVRSDVFCAYILVRIGQDGPQKRVMVILDRSGVNSPADKVRIRAFHPVPDPG